MSSNISKGARLDIVQELYLAVGYQTRVTGCPSALSDFFQLTRAILNDQVFATRSNGRLMGFLKKTPVWKRLLPFLSNNEGVCARKGCRCGEYAHTGPNTSCVSTHYKHQIANGWKIVPCTCPGFIKKEFK